MAKLSEVFEALVACPWERDLKLFWPNARTDSIQVPISVPTVELGDTYQTLHYDRTNLKSGSELAPGDVLWHQDSNVVALVVTRIDHKTVRVQGLAAPDTDEEIEAFNRTQGTGTWCCVAQAWKTGWELPSELYQKLPELVGMEDPYILDNMPGYRKDGRMSWVAQGLIDPDFSPPSVRRFYEQQVRAMQRLSGEGLPAEEKVTLPTAEELEPGEVRITSVPLDDKPLPKGQIMSYAGQAVRTKTGTK